MSNIEQQDAAYQAMVGGMIKKIMEEIKAEQHQCRFLFADLARCKKPHKTSSSDLCEEHWRERMDSAKTFKRPTTNNLIGKNLCPIQEARQTYKLEKASLILNRLDCYTAEMNRLLRTGLI